MTAIQLMGRLTRHGGRKVQIEVLVGTYSDGRKFTRHVEKFDVIEEGGRVILREASLNPERPVVK